MGNAILKDVLRLTGLRREELEIEYQGRYISYYRKDTCELVARYSERRGTLWVAPKEK